MLLFFYCYRYVFGFVKHTSTNLVAVGQTILEDIIAKFKGIDVAQRDLSKREFLQSRIILLGCALAAVGIVIGLKFVGFDIRDLGFSIYGGAMEKAKSVDIWIRDSTEDQAMGESLEHHETRARHYAEAKGWIVKEVYHLEAVSGKTL